MRSTVAPWRRKPQGRHRETGERALVTAPELSWALRDLTCAAGEVEHELARRWSCEPSTTPRSSTWSTLANHSVPQS